MYTAEKLLTIAIPTFNRAAFLQLCLDELAPQVVELAADVEILISDNASTDGTAKLVADHAKQNPAIRYVRNPDNIGSDRNIAQCFNLAQGRYVLIFGDDDIVLRGSLEIIVEHLRRNTYGVVFARAYGYDRDFRGERPWMARPQLTRLSRTDFLIATHVDVTFISSNMINKSLITDIDAEQFLGTRLVQSYLILEAVARAPEQAVLDGYLVACKRHNSGGYDPFAVFSADLDTAFRRYIDRALDLRTLKKIHNRILLRFFPYYILLALKKATPARRDIEQTLRKTFADNGYFRALIVPILRVPRPVGILACGILVTYGRIRRGEIVRLIQFMYYRLRNFVARR